LFANRADEGPSVLRLWIADELHREFAEHPSSPIRLSPQGARMAGGICRLDGQLFRVGQDLRGGYGDGVSYFQITQIGHDRYSEELIGDFRFGHCKGPHTINVQDGCAVFDFYADQFTPLAGIRRLIQRRAARRTR
jgi:hypothetical protein